MIFILLTGGTTLYLAGTEISVRGFQNPLLVLWVSLLVWVDGALETADPFRAPALRNSGGALRR